MERCSAGFYIDKGYFSVASRSCHLKERSWDFADGSKEDTTDLLSRVGFRLIVIENLSLVSYIYAK